MKSILILSGPIGAGKTTVARELVKISPAPISLIEGDHFWNFIGKTVSVQTRAKNFRTIMRAMTAAAVPFALDGFEVILDFSIPPWFLESVHKIAAAREIALHYVLLVPDRTVCAERAANRLEGVIPDYSIYHDFYQEFLELPRYAVNDPGETPTQLAETIRKGVDTGKFLVDPEGLR